MCLPGGDGTHTLHQAIFTRRAEQTFTNADFCHLLKNEYENVRSRLSSGPLSPRKRKLVDIRFVKFQTKATTTSYGTPAREPRVKVIGERCLPKGEEGWICGNDLLATVGAGMAMVASVNGGAFRVHERLNIHKLVPRKLQQPINPAESGSYGWGLYFVEKEYCKEWYKNLVLAATLVFASVGGIVFSLMVAKAFGSTIPGYEFREFRVIFAVYCVLFSSYHLRDIKFGRIEHVSKPGQI